MPLEALAPPPRCGHCATPLTQPFQDCAPGRRRLWECSKCLIADSSDWPNEGDREWVVGVNDGCWPSLRATPLAAAADWRTGLEFEMFHQHNNTDRVYDLIAASELRASGMGHDGSIPSPAGLEIKTPPAYGALVPLWITAVCDTARGYGMAVSRECGLHVHVQAPLLDRARFLQRLLIITKAIEPVIYAMLPGSRWNNGYSTALRLSRQDLVAARSGQTVMRTWGSSKNGGGSRYKGVNLEALAKYGTVEFRYHSATLNAEKVINWVRICHALMTAAQTLAPRHIPTTFESHAVRRRTMLALLGLKDLAQYVEERTALFGHNLLQLEAWAASLEAPSRQDLRGIAAHRNEGDSDAIDTPEDRTCSICEEEDRESCDCCTNCEQTADNCECCRDCGNTGCGYCNDCDHGACACTCDGEEAR